MADDWYAKGTFDNISGFGYVTYVDYYVASLNDGGSIGDIPVSLNNARYCPNYEWDCSGATKIDWWMKLQRWSSDTGWVTIGTRSGYISGTSPSNRTFTDVIRGRSLMRVVLVFSAASTHYTDYFRHE